MSPTLIALCSFSLIVNTNAKAPHLFFFLVDDMGFNDFSYRSSDLKDVAWPHVNALLNESLKIDTYYTMHLCTPTRGAFMTGRYPVRLGLQHGVIGGFVDHGLPLDEVTLADKLKHAGYATHAVGKWHLGSYNFASTPTYRGFDTYMGYYNGAEDHLTHELTGYLDLHRQWNVSHDNKTYEDIRNENGTFGTYLFAGEMYHSIQQHKTLFGDMPGFFYLPLQNVHAPLQSPGGTYDKRCEHIPNAERKTFCAMAAIADEAIGNLTSLIKESFAGEDYLVVISGDNGGMPGAAGNNFPLRGHKAELWEGGIRNNAIVWGSHLPEGARGKTYKGGLMHIVDWHATFAALGNATLKPKAALDGVDMWTAITTGAPSPRTEFLVNHDLCAGHGTCQGVEWVYRYGDMKVASGLADDTWYPLPTSDAPTKEVRESTAVMTPEGMVWWPESHYADAQVAVGAGLSPACIKEVKKECPNLKNPPVCSACIKEHWTDIVKECIHAPQQMVEQQMCSGGGSTLRLFNISADPTEHHDLMQNATTAAKYAALVKEVQAKVEAIIKGKDYIPPCNVPSGSCYNDDPNAEKTMKAHKGWYPWK